jgi:predicted Zn-dependent peptidase
VSALLSASLVDGVPLERHLADIGISAKFERTVDDLSVTAEAVPELVSDALHDILVAFRQPSFSPESVEKLNKDRRQRPLAPPPDVLQKTWEVVSAKLYPAAHRYHSDASTGLDKPSVFEREELENHLRSIASTEQFTVSFVGDIDANEARRAVEKAEGTKAGPRMVPHRSDARRTASALLPGAYFADDASASAAGLVFLCPIGARGSSEFADAEALSWLFSRAFEASSMRELHVIGTPLADVRESRDVTYLFLQLLVRGDGAPEAVRAAIRFADSLRTRDISPSGLGEIQADALRSITNAFDTTSAEADFLGQLATLDLGRDSVISELGQARRVDSSGIQAAAQRCFAPGVLRVVGYGNVRQAAEELERHGYGHVTVSENSRAKP